ncbi:hypothetical protein SAMN05444161_4580 [Rhizobiales bacterium GAS191]|nr:hypothetical protein SAMN05519103_03875 [Rhizobiales bacterium GAS113]SED99511.1 hypothetical protein SAMN05444161_4580 [Rhizobiales bacterium GAS191]
MESSRSQFVKDLIFENFETNPYPGDRNLVPEEQYHLEARQIAQYFRGKKWQDITLQGLKNDYVGDQSACLSFMTPEAFIYYLPAYLMLCINYPFESDMIYPSTIWNLTKDFFPYDPRFFEHRREEFKCRFENLALEKKRTIANFLALMHSLHDGKLTAGEDAQQALDRYWGQFLD